jgi:hypothetical protein
MWEQYIALLYRAGIFGLMEEKYTALEYRTGIAGLMGEN